MRVELIIIIITTTDIHPKKKKKTIHLLRFSNDHERFITPSKKRAHSVSLTLIFLLLEIKIYLCVIRH